MELMDVVKDWLVDHQYEGLFHGDTECGCSIDDFMPCGEPGIHCQPGVKAPCDCEDEECEFHIVPKDS